jgi:hypothetical protein
LAANEELGVFSFNNSESNNLRKNQNSSDTVKCKKYKDIQGNGRTKKESVNEA